MMRSSTFIAVVALLTFVAAAPYRALAQASSPAPAASPQPPARRLGGFVPGQQRPPGDPAQIAHGKALYAVNCVSCHGVDLRGGDLGGPNLLRSQVALRDLKGELIVPIIQGSRQDAGMPAIPINPDDSLAVAAYIRSVIETIGVQGKPPSVGKVAPSIVVGDAGAGQAYFGAKCASCHSADPLQVARGGVATGALGAEVRLARACIAYHDAGRYLPNRRRLALHPDGFDDATDIRGYRQAVIWVDRYRGHACVLPATLNNRNNQFALQVAKRDLRAQKVWAAQVAAPQVDAMAAYAVDRVQRLSVSDLRGVAGWPLLTRYESAKPACGGLWTGSGGRRRCLRQRPIRRGCYKS